VRGLVSSASRQLALLVEGQDPIQGMWESFGPEAQERILCLLAPAVARILNQQERER
jgi:hypothetical protein